MLKLVSRTHFERIKKRTGAEYRSKYLSSGSPFLPVLLCELGRAYSQREIEEGVKSGEDKPAHLGIGASARASLSYAAARRAWQLSEKVFHGLFEIIAAKVVGKKKFASTTSGS